MTKRNPVSASQNIWFDAEQVNADNLNVEQNYNNSIQSGIINNHVGTGILADSLTDKVLFNSDLVNGIVDGVIVRTQNQPSDNNYGNQLEISLSRSRAAGKRNVKIAIVGLDFQQNLQYETFVFKVNESQFTKKHYVSILQILINDLRGDIDRSFNLGGTIIIKEAAPYSLSRSTSAVSQTFQPNLFFRDFFTSPDYNNSVLNLLRIGLPYYNIDNLDIQIGERGSAGKTLAVNDVSTQIGQKFLANTNNIQKITLLLAASNPASAPTDDWKWNGEIVVSVYPLQNSLQCPTDIPPETLLGYSPSPVPLSQISFSYDTLLAAGVQLTTVPQPVEFIFSNTPLGFGTALTPGNYYAFAIRRSGAADTGEIYISSGNKYLPSDVSKLTVFNGVGGTWTDLTDEDLWFDIATDAVKVSDGQAYVSGNGAILPKTETDPNTGVTVDYCLDNLYFNGNDTFSGVLFAETEKNTPVQDLRTGNLIYSRQQTSPSVKLLSTLDVSKLQQTTDPLLIGNITDKNIKFHDTSSDAKYSVKLYTSSFVNNEIFIKIITDENDSRYDNNSTQFLKKQLLTGNLNKIKIFPDLANNPSNYYKVSASELITIKYGDVNNDGVVNNDDYDLLNSYRGFNFNYTPPLESSIIILNGFATYKNGYLSYKNPFSNSNAQNLSFRIINSTTLKVIDLYNSSHVVVSSPDDGQLNVAPQDLPSLQYLPKSNIARISSSKVDFKYSNSQSNLIGNKILILNPGDPANKGAFEIIGIDDASDDLIIKKIILNSDTMLQLFSSDLDDDYEITDNDAEYLRNYINKSGFVIPQNPTPAQIKAFEINNKIGTSFEIIRLVLEKYQAPTTLDRNDDYFSDPTTRSENIHLLGDVFQEDLAIQDGYIGGNPSVLRFEKQFSWEDYLVVANTENKLVPAIFDNKVDTLVYTGEIEGVRIESYNQKINFDPGRIDAFVPDNLIIGHGGEIVRENGDPYKIDFEVGTIVLEIPPSMNGADRSIALFENFVADYNETGVTKLGYPAMKFADSSVVQSDALQKNQIRFSASIQSFCPSLDGELTLPNGAKVQGVIVDNRLGVYIDYNTGVINLNFTNLKESITLVTEATRVQIHVFLKRGGFNNVPLQIKSEDTANIMKLISVFSGSIVGGASAVVDLEKDVTGVLPIVNGGTGMSTPLDGYVAGRDGYVVSTDSNGKLDASFYYKNPVYIYGISGKQETTSSASQQIFGALSFRSDSFILQDLKEITFEAIMQYIGPPGGSVQVKLWSVESSSYLAEFEITNTIPVIQKSLDLKSLLASDPTYADNIYWIEVTSSDGVNTAVCYMARLVVTYYNQSNGKDFKSPIPIIT